MALKPSNVKRKSTCAQYWRDIFFRKQAKYINQKKDEMRSTNEKKKNHHINKILNSADSATTSPINTFVAGKLPTHRFNHLSFRVRSPKPIVKLIDASVTSHQNWDEWSPLTRHRSFFFFLFFFFVVSSLWSSTRRKPYRIHHYCH